MSRADVQLFDFTISASQHISTDLAQLVVGVHEFPKDMPHETRVFRLFALIESYQLVRRVGELEHTGDWDWRIYVDWGEAHQIVPQPSDDWSMCDDISLTYQADPTDYLNRFERWNYLTVGVLNATDYDHDEQTNDVLVPIDQINRIIIEEL